eukprot:Tbor_TRINITY_DN5879_c1_g9::TRINITY_DN5879_c1_g9_i2::g.7113::m.7113
MMHPGYIYIYIYILSITIAWDLAGRVADISKLRKQHTIEEVIVKEKNISFRFVEGKTTSRENYVLSTKLQRLQYRDIFEDSPRKKKVYYFHYHREILETN